MGESQYSYECLSGDHEACREWGACNCNCHTVPQKVNLERYQKIMNDIWKNSSERV